MQVQSNQVLAQSITASQSLATVQTMLRAGLGCITYLRDLLPVDNFSESHFTSSSEDPLSQTSSHADEIPRDLQSRRNVSAFKIMTVSRGFTEEGDKLLNYLEYGIFDALKNQYLRSFIFAIYLDNKDPNNIVEAYTFNFNYHTIPGTDTVIPVVSLVDNGGAVAPNDVSHRKLVTDPVAEAARRGKPPSLGEVKKSVKALLRRLINATTQMDNLPKRRYATFKLFYNDHTPPEYEPPHFQPGDAVKDRWFFTTHDAEEVPEKWSVGQIETGHHGVNISIASIAAYLPSSTEDNNATFAGTTTRSQNLPFTVTTLTPAQEATIRERQVNAQMQDAEQRSIVWGVDGDDTYSDPDAEGDDDEDYVRDANGTYKRKVDVDDSGADTYAPIGLRCEDGQIVPLPKLEDVKVKKNADRQHGGDPMDIVVGEEAYFGGVSEKVPTCVGDLKEPATNNPQLAQTQQIALTQELDVIASSRITRLRASSPSLAVATALANIKIDAGLASQLSSPLMHSSFSASNYSDDIDTQMLKDMIEDGMKATEMEDSEMLDMETQVTLPVASCTDSIETFGPNGAESVDDIQMTPKTKRDSSKVQVAEDEVDNGLQCECGVSIEDQCTFCEGGCGRWFHIWCMGYHSTSDKRIPPKFICFDCRVRADLNWDLIEVHLYPQMLSKFKDLALFRRAIKIAEIYDPSTASEFSKLVGCDSVVARQLFKRLEVEGFIATETSTTDDLGLLEIRTKVVKGKTKTKGKHANPRKNLQKANYLFNKSSKRTPAYKDYFNPDHATENRMLGLSDLKASFKPNKNTDSTVDSSSTQTPLPFPAQSQTQEDSQFPVIVPLTQNVILDQASKRKMTDTDRPSKKIKISMGPAVDLGD